MTSKPRHCLLRRERSRLRCGVLPQSVPDRHPLARIHSIRVAQRDLEETSDRREGALPLPPRGRWPPVPRQLPRRSAARAQRE